MRIVMLDGDLGSSTRGQIFEDAYPERYFQMGIAEQNMLGVAAGMAKMGCIPFISTFVAFALHRPLDQIRVLIAQTGANVKITAGYTGLFTGRAGKTTIRSREETHVGSDLRSTEQQGALHRRGRLGTKHI